MRAPSRAVEVHVEVQGPIYRFGAYELNLPRYQLLRAGKHVRLARAPMELLKLLVESQGALLTREAIAACLWESPEMVDVDQGINTAVRRVREALADNSVRPRYVQTVVGRGYRFLVTVTIEGAVALRAEPLQPVDVSLVSEPDRSLPGEKETAEPITKAERVAPMDREPKGRPWKWLVAALLVGVGLSALALFEGHAVARRWWTSRTAERASKRFKAFRPISTNDGDMRVTAGAVSPDGRWVVYADRSGLLLKVVRDGHTEPLRSPPDFQCDRVAWSPMQLVVLASGVATGAGQEEVWAVSITGEAPRLLLREARNGVPSPDGRQMLFTKDGDREIWTAAMTGGDARRLVGDPTSDPITAVFWSGDGRRLNLLRGGPAYGSRYQSLSAATGAVLAEGTIPFFEAATALRNDRVLLLGASGSTSGDAAALWEMRTDAETGAIQTAPVETVPLEPGKAFGLTASEDGGVLSVVIEKGQPDVYTGVLEQDGSVLTGTKRLTFDTQADYPHSWLRDNETVVFESNRSGTFQIYRQRLRDAIAIEMTNGSTPAVLPRVTSDGRWILYGAKPRVVPSAEDRLMRLPVEEGAPGLVWTGGALDDFECSLRAAACVLRVQEDERALVFYALDPVRGRGAELARLPWTPVGVGGWSVSPDGGSLALPANTAPGIRVVRLVRGSGDHERVIRATGVGRVTGVSWSADGRGWYVTERFATVGSLAYIDARGRTRVLLKTPLNTWGVPSPDGRRLAYVDQSTLDSNVWLLQRR